MERDIDSPGKRCTDALTLLKPAPEGQNKARFLVRYPQQAIVRVSVYLSGFSHQEERERDVMLLYRSKLLL
jgi:hypothetical protein